MLLLLLLLVLVLVLVLGNRFDGDGTRTERLVKIADFRFPYLFNPRNPQSRIPFVSFAPSV